MPTESLRLLRIRGPLLLLLLGFWALALYQLAVFPPVTEDEPWIASTGWQLATRGVFGSPLFAGLWQMDRRYYDFMPLYPLVSSVLYRGAGVGIFQARFVSVILGTLFLALTFALGRRLFNSRVGLLAVLLALAIPLVTRGDTTGSLLLDLSRVARYDILVPVMELAACLSFLRGHRSGRALPFFIAGILAGLAALAHVYGALILVPLAVFALWQRFPPRTLLAMGMGVFIPALLYAIYVLSGWDAFRVQTQWYGNRFDLLDPAWYSTNLSTEIQRYLFSSSTRALLSWSLALLSVAFVVYAAFRRRNSGARFLILTLTTYAAAFALLFESKLPNYLAGLLPFIALSFAFLFDSLFQAVPRARRLLTLGAALAALLLLLTQGAYLNRVQAQTSPYSALITQLRAAIPPHAHVLGLHSYWLGMQDYQIRDWIVPLQWSGINSSQAALSMTAALDRAAPDVVIIDPRIRPFLSDSADPRAAQAVSWLRAANFLCTAQFTSRTYGMFQVYQRATNRNEATASCSNP